LDPPTLSVKVVKKLGEKFCMVAPENLFMMSLKSSKTRKKAVMKQAKPSDEKVETNKEKAQTTSHKQNPKGGPSKKEGNNGQK
jgi:hypothetical protein